MDKPATSNRLSASTGFGNSVARPFGNGGFSPSSNRNRPAANSYTNLDAPVGPQTQQQQVPFRNTRNRFQPSSATTTTTSTSTTEYPSTSRRYNRFGGRTQNLSSGGFRPATQTTTQANNPELSRLTVKTNNRRPSFISREVNEPIQQNKPLKNYPVKQGRVKLPLKDKLLKQQVSASSTPFRPALPFVTQKESGGLSDEYEETQEQLDNKLNRPQVKEPVLEKLQLQEAEVKPTAIDSLAKSTEISATTFKVPANSKEQQEEVVAQNSANASQSEETQKSEDNDEEGGENYSDEYSQEEHQDTESGSKEVNTQASLEVVAHTTEKPLQQDEEYHEEEEHEEGLKATVMPVTEATTTSKQEEPQVITTTESQAEAEADKITATVLMTTTESSGEKEQHQQDEESSADYDEEDYEEESGDEESGDDEEGEEEHEEEHEGSAHSSEHIDDSFTTTSTTTLEPSPLIDLG